MQPETKVARRSSQLRPLILPQYVARRLSGTSPTPSPHVPRPLVLPLKVAQRSASLSEAPNPAAANISCLRPSMARSATLPSTTRKTSPKSAEDASHRLSRQIEDILQMLDSPCRSAVRNAQPTSADECAYANDAFMLDEEEAQVGAFTIAI
ncbi:hypothetical protein B0H21DRAFT_756533 [Amylocystis lapponica]|nr:hypothetical protein B0H21DRAFT_756533 [Amylocystis lapponica]